MHKPLIYIAGKFGDQTVGDEEANRSSARSTAEMLWRIGYRAICPHSMLGLPVPSKTEEHEQYDDIGREDIMQTCLEVLSTCDCIYLMPNWRRSSGSIREYQHAQRLGLAVIRDYDEARHYLNCVHFARHKQFYSDDYRRGV